MAKQIKPTTKDSSPMVTGKAKNNRSAEDYAKPHTMTGKRIDVQSVERDIIEYFGKDPNKMVAGEFKPGKPTARVSLGDPTQESKSEGIEVRGSGAATKGRMARGPMA